MRAQESSGERAQPRRAQPRRAQESSGEPRRAQESLDQRLSGARPHVKQALRERQHETSVSGFNVQVCGTSREAFKLSSTPAVC